MLEFVRAELMSPRFSERYHTWFSQHGIKEPVMLEHLGYGILKDVLLSVRPGLFKTLPTDIVWREVALDAQDWDTIRYMNESVWTQFSSGTRLVLRGVNKLGQQHHETLTKRVSEITAQFRAGEQVPKIILVSTSDLSKLTILEGHVRATTFVASGLYKSSQILAILGTSASIQNWAWY